MVGFSVIIPTRNEEENIDPLLRRLLPAAKAVGVDWEIVFVDDSSSDRTREQIAPWTSSHPVRLLCRDQNGSLAGAVVAGAMAAHHELVVVLDADLSHPPEKIAELLQPLLDSTHDLVIGSRYVEGASIPHWPLSRKIASRLAGLPARLFSAVQDPMAGFFATGRHRLAAVRPDVPGFKICLELLAAAEQGIRVKEIPIVFNDRFAGFSKMNLSVVIDYLRQLRQLSGADSLTLLFLLLISCFLADWLSFLVLVGDGWSPSAAHLAAGAVAGGMGSVALFVYGLGRKRGAKTITRVTQLCCLPLFWGGAVAVQGAVLAIAREVVSLPPGLAFGPAALCGSLFFLLPLFILQSGGFQRLAERVQLRFAAVGLVVLALALRSLYLGLPELVEREAYYWNFAQHPALAYLEHPPLVAWLVWLSTAIFGTSEAAVRLPAFCCWFVVAFFSYRLSSRACGRSAALGVVMLVAGLPYFFGIGLIMTPDAPLHAAWAALLYYLYRALVENRSGSWLGVGLSLGVGLLAGFSIGLLVPALLCFVLFDRQARQWLCRVEPLGALLVALLLFLPVLWWNFLHDWASFASREELRLDGTTVFSTHYLLAYLGINLTPVGIVAVLLFFVGGRSYLTRFGSAEMETDAPETRRRFLFLLVMTAVPLLFFVGISATHEVRLNWTSPLWLSTLPFFGAIITGLPGQGQLQLMRVFQRAWFWTVAILLVTYGSLLHYAVLGLPGLDYPKRPFLVGWQGLAGEVEKLVEAAAAETGSRPLVVGMDPYQISSGLAFYRSKIAADRPDQAKRLAVEETVGWHLFSWDAQMYEQWADPAEMAGRDILAVASSRIRVEFPYFRNRITGMGPILDLVVSKDGQPIRTMYCRLLYGYRPDPAGGGR
ncbi:glycosyltransferase family 39 protein [Desulfofustis limnaeus]|jgi:dolichol-phosphate mannosyltransferase|uniref:Glycosyltransferase n=1 Tax=Desulfofustis limnaeus TaxID=2740163 RepID=A0ABM7W7D1_9BACT|nr:glycosyltransferase family 39 protein [Desulfofustis limnaeus]MDX9896761.1 glycosyltransferase family 39 protein [Desulfofustis sp.]BDD86795.1 hypothetical protein DPPLL_11600 [Desulfofustis limnaeus]